MNVQFHFTQSSRVLNELSRSSFQSPIAPESTENVNSLEYIDTALGLLGHVQKAHDDRIRQEFEQQRRFITDKFGDEQYANGQRDAIMDSKFAKLKEQFERIKQQLQGFKEEVGHRFEEVGHRFEEVGHRFEEVGHRFEEVGHRFDNLDTKMQEFGQRFSEMDARMFNSLAYRVNHQVHPVAIFGKNGRLERPDESFFPKTIKDFWRLSRREKG